MKEFEYKTLVAAPEFEVRCENFVQAIKDEISGRYRPTNLTRAYMEDLEQQILRLLARGADDSSNQEKIQRLQAKIHRVDVSSAKYFAAMVGFYGKSPNQQVVEEEITQAFDEVDILSFDYGGERIHPSFIENISSQVNASIPAEVHTLYEFRDRQNI